jgi:hypothetical protein
MAGMRCQCSTCRRDLASIRGVTSCVVSCRCHDKLVSFGTTTVARTALAEEVYKLVQHNPALASKLSFPQQLPPHTLCTMFAEEPFLAGRSSAHRALGAGPLRHTCLVS